MVSVHSGHFGGNIVLTNDSAKTNSAFQNMLDEIYFYNLRYPGGGVTEGQTWKNGGLAKMFGSPMDPSEEGYVMTLREALALCEENRSSISIVIPTFQFYDRTTQKFDTIGFDRYIKELEKAILDHPNARISAFEIGNEYWAEINAAEYGFIANKQIPFLDRLNDNLAAKIGSGWDDPAIGIQAGTAWRASGEKESKQIAEQISLDNRKLVDTIYQHAYPNPNKDFDTQKDGAIKPALVFEKLKGFNKDLKIFLSEFNIGIHASQEAHYGVNQGAVWIEEFGRYVDAGVDGMDHWGLAYKWLTTKFYDTKFPSSESVGGEITAIATPMGQIYDLASSHLVGKSTMSDEAAVKGLYVKGEVGVTGFEEDGERVVFLSNTSGKDTTIDVSKINGQAVFGHHIVPADSPETPWYDESIVGLPSSDKILDARGDMKVISGYHFDYEFTLSNNEMLVLVIGDADRDYIIEGAHNVSNYNLGQVDDFIISNQGSDILRGHAGNDTLDGGKGNDVLSGGQDNDVLRGSDGNDVLLSGNGADVLSGQTGNDLLLIGGTQSDDAISAFGGTGADLFILDNGRDVVIQDFTRDDTLGFGGLFSDRNAFNSALLVVGENLIISLGDWKYVLILNGAKFRTNLVDMVLDFKSSNLVENCIGNIIDYFTDEQRGEFWQEFKDLAQSPKQNESIWDEHASGFETFERTDHLSWSDDL
ncbi:calcium-binding protein [Paracoccus shandongensis]|uniref:calcium-binding protein n=1 Tax=Paracoccus shandongensis TaxID=2816048 RepID=UPI001A8DEBBC|nr:calcium-binding protein [Paracoccus shandongensis]